MADSALVDRDLASGRELLLSLDQANFPVFAALWLFRPESADWTFYIGSVEVDNLGKHDAYAHLQAILDGIDSRVSLREISLVGSADPFLSLIVGAFGIGGVSEVRVQNSMINGVLIPDALIYRLQRPPSPMGPRTVQGSSSNTVRQTKPRPTKRTNAPPEKGRKK
jgi:hypothetical protein